jgi:hypothetical protein
LHEQSHLIRRAIFYPPITVGNPPVTIFPPDDDGPGVVDSKDGGSVPIVLPPPLIGGGENPYNTKVSCADSAE